MVIVEALTKWKQYLLDTTKNFEFWTDHENLKYFREPHKLKWMTSKIVLKIARLQFHILPYPRKNKYKSRYPIKRGSGGYQGQQQRCSNAERRTLGKTADNSRYQNDMK